MNDQLNAPRPILSVSGITKRYGDRIAVADASFELYPGEVLAVVGESGSGKSTLLNCVSARLRPDEGRVDYRTRHEGMAEVFAMSEAQRRLLARTGIPSSAHAAYLAG